MQHQLHSAHPASYRNSDHPEAQLDSILPANCVLNWLELEGGFILFCSDTHLFLAHL